MLSWRQICRQSTVAEDWNISEGAHQEKRCVIRTLVLALLIPAQTLQRGSWKSTMCTWGKCTKKKKIRWSYKYRHMYVLRYCLSCVLPQILKSKDIHHSPFVALLIHLLDYIHMVGTWKWELLFINPLRPGNTLLCSLCHLFHHSS